MELSAPPVVEVEEVEVTLPPVVVPPSGIDPPLPPILPCSPPPSVLNTHFFPPPVVELVLDVEDPASPEELLLVQATLSEQIEGLKLQQPFMQQFIPPQSI